MNDQGVRLSAFAFTLGGVLACEQRAASIDASYGELIDTASAVIIGLETPELFRVGSASLVANGQIAIENRGSGSILVFDTAGNYVRSIGKAGAGPKEFLGLWGVWTDQTGDSLYAWDVLSTKLATWTVLGEFVGSHRIQSEVYLKPQGRFLDGSILAARPPHHQAMSPGEVRVADATLYRVFPDGDSIVQLIDVRWESTAAGQNPRGGTGATYVPQPFGLRAWIAVGDTSFYYTAGETWTIHGYTWQGAPLGYFVGWGRPIVDLTPEIRSRYIDWSIDGSPKEVRPGVLRFQSSLTFPRTVPTYEELLLDTGGNVWAGEYVPPFGEQIRPWHVFGPNGDHLGSTTLRADIKLAMITPTHILAIARGNSDIERVLYAPVVNDPRGQTQVVY